MERSAPRIGFFEKYLSLWVLLCMGDEFDRIKGLSYDK